MKNVNSVTLNFEDGTTKTVGVKQNVHVIGRKSNFQIKDSDVIESIHVDRNKITVGLYSGRTRELSELELRT